MTNEFALDRSDVVSGGDHFRQSQIIMRLKMSPVTSVRLLNLEFEFGLVC